jgi:TonB-linked SusC/RagA family outer membrane protein
MQLKALCKHCKLLLTPQTLRCMKITAFILLIFCLHVSANTLAQNVTLSEHNAPLEKVISEIKQQTGYSFFYNEDWLKQAKPVDLDVKNTSLDKVLQLCFVNQPFSYAIVNKTIVLKLKEKPVEKQEIPILKTIHGKVLDETNQPLTGATIKVKGQKQVTSTDSKGEFSLNIDLDNAVLQVSYVGYESLEFVVNAKDDIQEIHLKKSQSKLDEIQVIAHGEITQRYNVGSISQVTAKEIEEQPVSNPLMTLEGQVPGLVVDQTSGLPGSSVKIQIRGQNSLSPTGNPSIRPLDNPLFIVNGVPFSPNNTNINLLNSVAAPGSSSIYGNSYGGISPFNSINPDDIESIEVLKDADATAIYGSRGANGVILITTKKGSAGKTKFSASIWTGDSKATNLMPLMNTQQYLLMRQEALRNDGIIATKSNSPDLLIYDTTKNTNWEKYFLGGTAHTTDASGSLSGGDANNQFLLGFGDHKQSYIIPGNFSDNVLSINSNFHHTSTDKRLSIDFSFIYSYDQNNSASTAKSLSAFTLAPDFPALQNPDGSLNWNYKGYDPGINPLQYLYQTYNIQTYNLMSNVQVGYKLFEGMTVRTSLGYNNLNANEISTDPIAAQDPSRNPQGSSTFGSNGFNTWIIEPQAEYKRIISKGKLDLLLGGTLQKNANQSRAISASNYTNDALLTTLTAAGSTTINSDAYSIYKYSAIFGRINYVWQNEYILDLTGNRDGSSRFGPGKQFGNFGSVGGGWIFSEAPFIKNKFPELSYGKIRGSYGTTGNDNIGNYQYLDNWTPITPAFQGNSGYIPQNLYKPDFSWSVTSKLEAGLELGFWNDRLLAEVSWFRDRSGNQLVSYQLPIQTGFASVTENFPAVVQNTGWEFHLTSLNIKTTEFSWNLSLNLTIPENKLISFPGLATSSYAHTYIVGQSLSVLNKFLYLGVNPTTGVFQFASQNGPTATPKTYTDYRIIGNLDPKYYGGFTNTFTYKGLQMDVFFEYRKQMGLSPLGQIYSNDPIGFQSVNQPLYVLSRWQQPGNQANVERFSSSFSGSAYSASTNFINSSGAYTDASFIRLKTISISYPVKSEFLKKMQIEGMRLFINGQNLLTMTKYPGSDPENQSFFGVPPLKTIVAGIKLTF